MKKNLNYKYDLVLDWSNPEEDVLKKFRMLSRKILFVGLIGIAINIIYPKSANFLYWSAALIMTLGGIYQLVFPHIAYKPSLLWKGTNFVNISNGILTWKQGISKRKRKIKIVNLKSISLDGASLHLITDGNKNKIELDKILNMQKRKELIELMQTIK